MEEFIFTKEFADLAKELSIDELRSLPYDQLIIDRDKVKETLELIESCLLDPDYAEDRTKLEYKKEQYDRKLKVLKGEISRRIEFAREKEGELLKDEEKKEKTKSQKKKERQRAKRNQNNTLQKDSGSSSSREITESSDKEKEVSEEKKVTKLETTEPILEASFLKPQDSPARADSGSQGSSATYLGSNASSKGNASRSQDKDGPMPLGVDVPHPLTTTTEKTFSVRYWIHKETPKQFGVYKSSTMKTVYRSRQLAEEKIIFSVLEVSDPVTAHYQSYMSDLLGHAALKVYFVDDCIVGLEEISSDFRSWYESLHSNYTGNPADWPKHIEPELKKLFRGISRSLSSLYPSYAHGNWIDGLAICDGEARIYNMRVPGNKGCENDLKALLQLFVKILLPTDPARLDNDSSGWDYRKYCSPEFALFLNSLDRYDMRNVDNNYHFTPFYWSGEERLQFIEAFYDMFWGQKRFKLKEYLNLSFRYQWVWWELVPSCGPLRGVYDFKDDKVFVQKGEEASNEKDEENSERKGKLVDPCSSWHTPIASVAYFRNCRHHYNNHCKLSARLTLLQLEDEVNRIFNICHHLYEAIVSFLISYYKNRDRFNVSTKDIKDLEALMRSIGS